MSTKEYLLQAFTLYGLIRAKESRIRQLRDMREHVSGGLQTGTRVQTSIKTDSIGEFTAVILDAEAESRKDIARLVLMQKEIEKIIDTVRHSGCKAILYDRYINLKNWQIIAEDNHYSLKWVHVLHNRGLKEVTQIIHESSLTLY